MFDFDSGPLSTSFINIKPLVKYTTSTVHIDFNIETHCEKPNDDSSKVDDINDVDNNNDASVSNKGESSNDLSSKNDYDSNSYTPPSYNDDNGNGASASYSDSDSNTASSSLFPDAHAFKKRYKSNFFFGHNNVNSFRHKFVSFLDILENNVFDYLAISETKLDDSFPDAQFRVNGYDLIRQDHTCSSGGILIYIRSDIPYRRLKEIEHNDNGVESVSIEIVIGNAKTIITCLYKHPSVKNNIFKTIFSDIANKAYQYSSDVIFIGDINCDPKKNDLICDLCCVFGLCNLITTPTCFKAKEPTLLDVILVSNKGKYLETLNCSCPVSDHHNLIGGVTRRHAPIRKPRYIKYRSYKHFNDDDYITDVSYIPFHVCEIFDDVDDAAWLTSKLLIDVIDKHAPMKQRVLKYKPVPYMNAELRKAIFKRNMIRNKFKKYGKLFWEENRRMRNRVAALRKKSIRSYFSEKCANIDKSFWKTISPFMTNKSARNSENIILHEGDKIVNDDKEVANIFNEYFVNIASAIGSNKSVDSVDAAIFEHAEHPSIVKIAKEFNHKKESFAFKAVSPSVIRAKLKNINSNKSTGYDDIPGKLLRIAHNELAMPLTYLLNSCICHSVFPDTMKPAEVSPVFKKSDRLCKKNFRPVSILTALSKLFESVVNDQLVPYFTDVFNMLLCAFRNGYSCQTLLIKCIEDWKCALDKKELIGTMFMDLSSAFDCLPHSLLISKMYAYGLNTSACELVFSYLSSRKQRVKINNTKSDWVYTNKGVPQGSILGPLLFNIFINDLFYFIDKCSLHNYADDNSLSVSSSSIETVLSSLKHDGANAVHWFAVNGMKANPDKFQLMIISNRETEPVSIKLNESIVISSENCVKVLGVYIDHKLKFYEHVKHICKKASRQTNALSRISRYLNPTSNRIIYNSFIRSNFEYCPLVWNFCGRQCATKVEKLNERVLRVIYKDYTSSYTELLIRGKVSSLVEHRARILIIEVFKILKGVAPPCLHQMFKYNIPSYSFRNKFKLEQPLKRTNRYGLRSLTYLGAKLWNTFSQKFDGNIYEYDLSDFKKIIKDAKLLDINDSLYEYCM
jgi:hypothetical protein